MKNFWISLGLGVGGPLVAGIGLILDSWAKGLPLKVQIAGTAAAVLAAAWGVFQASFRNPDGTTAKTAWKIEGEK